MDSHLLQEIEIKNFKCFDNFKASGFKRVNLIGGKNNVGKTALMEACFINVHAQDIKKFTGALVDIKRMRETLNRLMAFIQDKNKSISVQTYLEKNNHFFSSSNINSVSYNIEDSDGIKHYIFTLNGKELKININDFSFEIDFIREIQFIDNFGLSNIEIIKNYSSIQKKDAENILNRFIKNFDPSIEVFKIIDDTPQCKKNGDYLELTEFGDGVRYLVSIVSALYQCENGYLFIDEIDNGIHYTMLDQLWEIILTLAHEQNVQVFAITHSKECIESFYQAAKQLEEKEITYTIMTQLKSGAIDAGVYNYDLLENSMEQEHEVRGW